MLLAEFVDGLAAKIHRRSNLRSQPNELGEYDQVLLRAFNQVACFV